MNEEMSKEEMDEIYASRQLRRDKPMFQNVQQLAIFVQHCKASYEDGPSIGSTTFAAMESYREADLYGVGIDANFNRRVKMPETPLYLEHEQLLLDVFKGIPYLQDWVSVRIENYTQARVAKKSKMTQQAVSKRVIAADQAIEENMINLGIHWAYQ